MDTRGKKNVTVKEELRKNCGTGRKRRDKPAGSWGCKGPTGKE
jgi:hypothetical protein